jgi:hypothetical protein
MNPDYARTFARHRLVFIVPVVLTTLIALLFVLGSPKVYEAQANLLVDTPAPEASSFDQTNPTVTTPAAQAQQLLNELLATRSFRLAVGKRGGLQKYLATHSSSGLLDTLRGKQPLDNRVVQALDAKHVMTSLPGPQILGISFKGPDPAVAANTLWALIRQLGHERASFRIQREEGAVTYYQGLVDAARAALGTATTSQEVAVAARRLTNASKSLNQTKLTLAATKLQKGSFVVRDAPKPPTGSVSGKKKVLFALVAGLFLGGLLSFLGVVVVSGRESRAPTLARVPRLGEQYETPWMARAAEYGLNGDGAAHETQEEEEPAEQAERARE